jgi:hypothetical protein
MVFTLVWLFRRCEVRWLAFLQAAGALSDRPFGDIEHV